MMERFMESDASRNRKGPLIEKVLHPAASSMIRVACEELLPQGNAHVLELLAGPVNVMPGGESSNELTGLGTSLEELWENDTLSHRVLADLNASPVLPFRSDCFDGAVLFFGVERLRSADKVFEEVSRVLRPGALFVIAYSSVTDATYGDSKWDLMDDQERLSSIVSSLEKTNAFGPVTAYGTKRRIRSESSKKRHPAKEHPRVWIAYVKNRSGTARAESLSGRLERPYEDEEDPLQCPYCGDRLRKYAVPHSAYEIDYWYEADFLYICFNDACPYFERGWEWMWSKVRRNVSYRHMYNPTTHKSGPIPVPTRYALRDGIVDEA